ncbi:hypothetical protein V7128_01880 [Neobacillus vireti]|uniref:hypothetical protein n=1 Tax=Neobacillus vireti TaxID=220686 RepID=UPI0030006851
MEHYKLMVEFMSKEELNIALFEAFTENNHELAKIISDQLLEIKLEENNQIEEKSTMKELTFKFDCELNSDSDYIKGGTKVQVVQTGKQYVGFVKVLITNGFSYDDKPIEFVPFTDHFSIASFVELSEEE